MLEDNPELLIPPERIAWFDFVRAYFFAGKKG
jgi:hypothetical protein